GSARGSAASGLRRSAVESWPTGGQPRAPPARSGRLRLRAGAPRHWASGDGGPVDVEAQRTALPELLTELRRRLEPVLHEQMQVVALVKHLDPNVRVQLAQAAALAVVLLRH